MTFTYNSASLLPLHLVRYLVGDVDSHATTDARLDDEEILRELALRGIDPAIALTTQTGGISRAAAACCRALAIKLSRKAEGSAGPNSFRPMDRVDRLRQRARELEAQAGEGAVPFAGGMRISTAAENAADTDIKRPRLRDGMFDHPGVPQQGS